MSTPVGRGGDAVRDTSLSSANALFAAARQACRLPHWALAFLMGFVFVFGAGLIGLVLAFVLGVGLPGVLPGADPSSTTASPTAAGLDSFILLTLSFAPIYLFVALWVRRFEGRPFRSIGFAPGGVARKVARGAALGLLFFAAAVGIMALSGNLSLRPVPVEQTGLWALGGVLLAGMGFLVQGPAEEVLTRGWILGSVGARYGLLAGILLNSLVFMLVHLLNPNVSPVAVVNLLLVATFLSLYALREGAIWGVCAWHWTWNWAQGNLFGFHVSGQQPEGGSLLPLREAGPDLFTGGAFGPEGGFVVTLVLAVGIAALLLAGRSGPSDRSGE